MLWLHTKIKGTCVKSAKLWEKNQKTNAFIAHVPLAFPSLHFSLKNTMIFFIRLSMAALEGAQTSACKRFRPEASLAPAYNTHKTVNGSRFNMRSCHELKTQPFCVHMVKSLSNRGRQSIHRGACVHIRQYVPTCDRRYSKCTRVLLFPVPGGPWTRHIFGTCWSLITMATPHSIALAWSALTPSIWDEEKTEHNKTGVDLSIQTSIDMDKPWGPKKTSSMATTNVHMV